MGHFLDFLTMQGLSPHGICLLWQPELIWLHAVADAIIGVSYYSIPLALAYFVSHRTDIAFGWIFWMFAAFILACGTTHFMDFWSSGIPLMAPRDSSKPPPLRFRC